MISQYVAPLFFFKPLIPQSIVFVFIHGCQRVHTEHETASSPPRGLAKNWKSEFQNPSILIKSLFSTNIVEKILKLDALRIKKTPKLRSESSNDSSHRNGNKKPLPSTQLTFDRILIHLTKQLWLSESLMASAAVYTTPSSWVKMTSKKASTKNAPKKVRYKNRKA